MRGVLAETALLFMLGLGAGLGLAAIALTVLAAPLAGIAPGLALDPMLALQAAGLAAALALMTGALPAVNALRIPPVSAMKGA